MTKQNKKGFTLVELLAVIAILAILMLLITPQILNLFSQGKKNTFILEVQSIYKRAGEEFTAGQFSTSGAKTSYCHVKGSTDESLNLNFDYVLSYKVTLSPTGTITSLIAEDNAYRYESTGDTVKITDINDESVIEKTSTNHTITCQ